MRKVQLQAICNPYLYFNRAGGIAMALFLAACGGGGGGGGGGVGTAGSAVTYAASTTLANLCNSPRAGTDDRLGSLAKEKDYIRSFIDETYLWYRDIPSSVVAANYSTPQLFFDALKTNKTTDSGVAVDQFHWSQTTESWDAASAGTPLDYGIRWASFRSSTPRDWRVAEVDAGSPAALAGVKRGDKLTRLGGYDFLYSTSNAAYDAFDTALDEAASVPHSFAFNFGADIILTPTTYTQNTVQKVQTFAAADGRKVGYFVFDHHLEKSEAELIAAINQLRAANVDDLVIDLRYNGGGLLYIASELAYMIAGPTRTANKTFEQLTYNDKLTAKNTSYPFYSLADSNGQALPTLNLSRVTLLVTRGTASASESIINSLRGVDVAVNLIGATTRGKPYGFVPQDNCGTTYFAIQFNGVNNKGWGAYADGFAPTCPVTDDLAHARGDVNETMLSAALSYRLTGSCPVVSSAPSGFTVSNGSFRLVRPPSQEMRILNNRPHL